MLLALYDYISTYLRILFCFLHFSSLANNSEQYIVTVLLLTISSDDLSH